tara:strand:- start:116 stop:982 length:867 start_codon:yes stop_codon:yes gene_type:complete
MAEGLTQGQAMALTTAVSGAGSLVGGLVGMANQAQLESQAAQQLSAANQNLDQLLASQPSLSTPAEYYEAVKQAYDQRLMQQRLEDINRSLATTTQAASQFGARGLGALMQASQQAQQAQRDVTLTQQQLQTQALGQLASAREREARLREARSTRDIELGYDAKALGEARVAQAEQQRVQNIANLATGVAGIGGGIGAMLIDNNENGGKIVAKRGVKVTKTPGEFSHKRNPLHVTNNDGEKVAELTGGEYVFNPEQSKKMLALAQDGDSPLHKFVRRLLERFEKESNG